MNEVCLIDPAVNYPETDCCQRIAHWCESTSTHLPAIEGLSSSLKTADSYRAVIVLGSATYLTQKHPPWVKELSNFLDQVIRVGTPLLGICFGHQLIGLKYGAKIARLPQKELGFRLTRTTRPLGKQAGLLAVSHQEVLTSCPDEMTPILFSETHPYDGLAHRSKPIWTCQAHPEATEVFCQNNRVPYSRKKLGDAMIFGESIIKMFFKIHGC